MKNFKQQLCLAAGLAAIVLAGGCEGDTSMTGQPGGDGGETGGTPVFTLAWSEYPSWSAFGVAEERGLIDGEQGRQGTVEAEHGVDIVLRQLDYDTCLTQYATGDLDAVCITNIDILEPARAVPAVAVLPTSTSAGADAVLAAPGVTMANLKETPVKGLERSVSEYMFRRGLQTMGENPDEYQFVNMDPANAAAAMQTGNADTKAIAVWNPFVLQTEKTRPDVTRLFDSSAIEGEIVDMVVMSRAAYERPGGPAAAKAIAEAFYGVNEALAADGATRDETLVALGARFGDLTADEMAMAVEQTKFYATPAEAVALFESPEFKRTMDRVKQFAQERGLLEGDVTVGYADTLADGAAGDLVVLTNVLTDLSQHDHAGHDHAGHDHAGHDGDAAHAADHDDHAGHDRD